MVRQRPPHGRGYGREPLQGLRGRGLGGGGEGGEAEHRWRGGGEEVGGEDPGLQRGAVGGGDRELVDHGVEAREACL